MGALYKIDFPNGKSYIGITRYRTAEQRFVAHRTAARKGSQKTVHRALRKYGEENIKLTTLAIYDDAEALCLAEQRAIVAFATKSPRGYNMTDGGDGVRGLDEESRSRQRAAIKDGMRRNCSEGKFTEIMKERWKDPAYRSKVSGANHYQYGVPRTDETRQKLRAANLGTKSEVKADARRKFWADPEKRAGILEAQARGRSKQGRAEKQSEARKKSWADPEYRARIIAAQNAGKRRAKLEKETV